MTSRSASLLAWPLCILSIGLALLGLFYLFSSLDIPVENRWGFRGFPALFVLELSVIGALIASRQPRNQIGWIFCLAGLFNGIQLLGEEHAVYAGADLARSVVSIVITWIADWIWVLIVGPLLTFFLLLFPSGKSPSPRWRPVAWLAAIALSMAAFGFATLPGPLENTASVINPFGIPETISGIIIGVGSLLMVVSMFLSTTSLALRLRSSNGEEREQLKWLAYTATLAAFAMAITLTLSFAGIGGAISDFVEVLAIIFFLGIIASAGIAILKYRLYDIDLIINRSLVYGPLTAILAGAYIAGIQLFRVLFIGLTGQTSDAAIVLTTLAVAAAFTPVKNRLQGFVDRHFKEVAYHAKNLDIFREQLWSVVQVLKAEQVVLRFLREAVTAFDANSGSVYLVRNGQDECIFTHGTMNGLEVLNVPLEHDGARVGALVLGPKNSGLLYTPQDRELLNQTAKMAAEAVNLAGARGSQQPLDHAAITR